MNGGPCLEYRDRFDLNQPVRVSKGADFDKCRCRRFFGEKLLAYRRKVSAIADVDEIGIELDDVVHRSARALYQRLERFEYLASLRLEIAGAKNAPVFVVSDLT